MVLSELNPGGYYNKTVHECVLKLHLPLEIINDIYKNLYNKNEVSGVFYVDENDKITHADKNEGDTSSVYTPNNVINYHTHPINAYREGKTSYGSPSGEDYRETLKFALSGNKAHLVFTIEGLYTIQVSPCKIKKMKELLNDEERGVLIFLIEEYFKTTHDFRCVDELNDLSSKQINITPYSFVDFANTYDIPNLLCSKKSVFKKPNNVPINKTGHSGIHSSKNSKLYAGIDTFSEFSRIPNMGFPSITGDYITNTPLKSFIKDSDFESLRSINKMGEESNLDKSDVNEITKILESIAKKFNSVPCAIEWNSNPNAWFFVNFFPTQHYINNVHKRKNKYVMPETSTKQLYITHEPFIRIFSNNATGCTVSKIAKTHNFNMNKKFIYNSNIPRNSTFGKNKLQLRYDIKYLKKLKIVKNR
jgi:hypothetical protein